MSDSESGLKIRTKLNVAKTLRAMTDQEYYQAGDMIMVEDTIGVVVEDVDRHSEFVLVYEAEKIVVPKCNTTCPIRVGDTVYYDMQERAVTKDQRGTIKCGKALEEVPPEDMEVLIDLIVMV